MAFARDGTVDGWLGRFNAMSGDFGTVPSRIAPERYHDNGLFLSA